MLVQGWTHDSTGANKTWWKVSQFWGGNKISPFSERVTKVILFSRDEWESMNPGSCQKPSWVGAQGRELSEEADTQENRVEGPRIPGAWWHCGTTESSRPWKSSEFPVMRVNKSLLFKSVWVKFLVTYNKMNSGTFLSKLFLPGTEWPLVKWNDLFPVSSFLLNSIWQRYHLYLETISLFGFHGIILLKNKNSTE